MNNESAITTVGLSKIYNKKNQNIRALDEFSINIPKGSKIITGSVIKTRSPKKGDVVTYNVGNLSETKIRLI